MKALSLHNLLERLGLHYEHPKHELTSNSYDRYVFWAEKQVERISH